VDIEVVGHGGAPAAAAGGERRRGGVEAGGGAEGRHPSPGSFLQGSSASSLRSMIPSIARGSSVITYSACIWRGFA